jgi:hypothetical protein
MPTRPKRFVPPGTRPRPQPDRRQGSTARGYDIDWQRFRRAVLAQQHLSARDEPHQTSSAPSSWDRPKKFERKK